MKRVLKIAGFSIAGLFLILLVCRFTGMLNYARIATPSNEPALKAKSIVFCSNLKKPARFDFILYRYNSPEFGKSVWIHRLCGLPGDRVQLINGELFINNKSTETEFKTYHSYVVTPAELAKLEETRTFIDDEKVQVAIDTVVIQIDKASLAENKITARILLADERFNEVSQKYNRPWTADNFGPLVIPADSYFVLGDNRSNSMDSRFTGLIPKSDFVGTVLGH